MKKETRARTVAAAMAIGVAAVLLGSCQDEKPAVSLDEAKRITAQFSGQSFVPPPRSISDITTVLDRHRADPAKAAALHATAEAKPPAGAAREELAEFFYKRGTAAAEIGRIEQAIDDLKTAEKYFVAVNDEDGSYRTVKTLGLDLLIAGRLMDSLRTWSALVESREKTKTKKGQLLAVYALTARSAAIVGNIPFAESLLDRADVMIADSGRMRAPDTIRKNWARANAMAWAELYRRTGRLALAEAKYREALELSDQVIANYKDIAELPGSDASPTRFYEAKYATTVHLADALSAEGRLVEAEVEARKALQGFLDLFGRNHEQTSSALVILAAVLIEQGRPVEGQHVAAVAADILRKIGHGASSFRLAKAEIVTARAAALNGAGREAQEIFRRLARDLRNEPTAYDMLLGTNPGYGAALLAAGQVDEALGVFQRRLDVNLKNYGEKNYLTAEAQGYVAAAMLRSGDRGRALALFRAAVPILLSPSRVVDDENTGLGRERRLKFIVENYLRLLSEIQGTTQATAIGDVAAEAFHVADAVRSSTVQRALAASTARAGAANAELASLVRREQDARQQVAAMQGVLTNAISAPQDQQDRAALKSLRTSIDRLRDARASIREEIGRRFPDYIDLVDPRAATLEQARKALRTDEALLATYVADDRTYVWALRNDGHVAFAAVGLDQRQVAAAVAGLRRALDPNATTLGDIPAFDVDGAHRLYVELLKPVESGWKGARNLLVVAHDALGQLPFSVLVTAPYRSSPDAEGAALFASYRSVPFLVREVAVTQLPSVTSLVALRRLPAPDPNRKAFVGFGDPWFNSQQAAEAEKPRGVRVAEIATRGGATAVTTRGLRLVRRSAPATQNAASAEIGMLPRLPDTADEVRGVASALGADATQDVFLGRAANEQTVKTMDLTDRRVVMFATHGLVPGDLNGLVQPALALSAPSVAHVGGDGLLTLDEIVSLRLNADWVVLSACNTAAADGAGAEAVSGLGRAFFYAGTRALLVTNWPVETTSARKLTTTLFRNQVGDPTLTRAEALRRAMITLIDGPGPSDPATGRTAFSYAHPIFWAPFSLVGDGGGERQGS